MSVCACVYDCTTTVLVPTRPRVRMLTSLVISVLPAVHAHFESRMIEAQCGRNFPSLVMVANKADQKHVSEHCTLRHVQAPAFTPPPSFLLSTLQFTDDSVDKILQRRRAAIMASGRFQAALSGTLPDGTQDPTVSSGIFAMSSKHALVARLIQAGVGTPELAAELKKAIAAYDLTDSEDDDVDQERIKPREVDSIDSEQLRVRTEKTCRIVLRKCRFTEFEEFMRVRFSAAHSLLATHLQLYVGQVAKDMVVHFTTGNEVPADGR